MPDLITASQALALLPGLSMAEQLVLPGLVSPASRAVERHCKRPLAYASHVEAHRPGQTRKIRLVAPPVVPGTLEVRADFQQVAQVQCTDPTATRATVSLSATALTLARASAAMPPPVVLGLTPPAPTILVPNPPSPYPTLANLAVAVNATGAWSMAVLPGWATWLTSDLEPTPGLVSAHGVAAGLSAYTRGLSLWAMDDPANGIVELTEQRPEAFRFADRTWAGSGYGSISGAAFGYTSDPRQSNVRCSYQGGYDPAGLAAPPVPDDLALAVALTIRASVDSLQFSGMLTSINLGNTTVAVGEQVVIPDAAVRLLSPYRLRRF